ncbi:hypothetical protein PMAYCL1PPCAC_01193, partial [Pristionchus mayeri]
MSSPAKKKIKDDFDAMFDALFPEISIDSELGRVDQDIDLKSNASGDTSEKTEDQNVELSLQLEKKKKNTALAEFLIVDLPKRPLTRILSMLPPKDRLNARVNKKLNEIEAASKFHLKELKIVE